MILCSCVVLTRAIGLHAYRDTNIAVREPRRLSTALPRKTMIAGAVVGAATTDQCPREFRRACLRWRAAAETLRCREVESESAAPQYPQLRRT
jgi:hypothetical protein